MPAKIEIPGMKADVEVGSVVVMLDKYEIFRAIQQLPATEQHWIFVQLDRNISGLHCEA